MSACEFCREEVEDGAPKCHHCGESLTARAPQPVDDLSQVLGWAFQDPDWVVKIIIGTACLLTMCLLLPVCAVVGYKLRIARQQRRAPGVTPMPGWGEPGALIKDGAKVLFSMFLAMFTLVFAAGAFVGVGVLLDLALTGQPGVFLGLFGVVAYAGLLLGALAFNYLFPAVEMEVLETGSPFSALHVRALWRRLTQRPGDYFLMFIYHFVTGMIGGFLAFLLYAPVAWSMYTQGALLGRYLAQQRAKDAALGLEP